MSEEWGPPTKWCEADETPYVHWWRTKESEKPQYAGFETVEIKFDPPRLVPATLSLPVPGYTKNSLTVDGFRAEDVLQHLTPDAIGEVPKDTVLIGIVDTGIPLGHRRSRTKSGKTRFISSWQQSARFTGQEYLPCGRELFAAEINHLLDRHSHPDLTGPLNEDDFNLDAGLTVREDLSGDRELDYRFSHGAHVLDLAAGHDPLIPSDDPIQNSRIIAVNLPPQKVHGTAGNFLTIYAALAIERILLIADALWLAQHGEGGPGFPLVLNFSFGKKAGPKDGRSVWETIIEDLIGQRDARSPTQLVMPAGNQNLSRGNARKLLGPDRKKWKDFVLEPHLEVPLAVHPADRTSNFVEIWAKAQPPEDAKERTPPDEAKPSDFRLFVTPPGREDLEVTGLYKAGTFSDLADYGRVYCYAPFGQPRPHFIVCIAPTTSLHGTNPSAPAGVWKIKLLYKGTGVQEATFGVQTDLSGIRDSKFGLQSYFDHPKYETHLETGRLRDSYVDRRFIPVKFPDGHCEPWPEFGPIQRKGSHNALASWPDDYDGKGNDETAKTFFAVIGGYRISDDMPAIYSSTFDGDTKRVLGREKLTALYPSDDSPSHYGLLASGSKEGSVAALQGTSMAAALATRDIARAHTTGEGRRPGCPEVDERWVRCRAEEKQEVNGLKRGSGMVTYPGIGRIPRHGPC